MDEKAVTQAFAHFGVEYKVHDEDLPNEYFINGVKVSRDEAWKHVDNMFHKK